MNGTYGTHGTYGTYRSYKSHESHESHSYEEHVSAVKPTPLLQPTELAQRCRRIDWLLVDVDGVLTDGSIVYGDSGVELKAFHVRDGSGLKIWQREGKRAGIITGRSSPVVNVRA